MPSTSMKFWMRASTTPTLPGLEEELQPLTRSAAAVDDVQKLKSEKDKLQLLPTRRDVIAGLGSILLDSCLACHRAKPEPVSIMFMDPESLDDRLQRQHSSEKALR